MIGQKVRNKTEPGQEMFHVLARCCPFAIAALFLGCMPLSAAAATYSGGNGSSDAPFLINTAEDFKVIGESPADWGKQFKLMQDIDLSGSGETNLHMIGKWAALGSLQNQPFWGIFDGNGKTIANFRYRNMSADYVGLFQHVTGEIRDLKLVGAVVTGNKAGTGALVGCLEKGAVIRCSVEGVRVSGDMSVGALVGEVEGGGAVHTSFSNGAVSGRQYVGGLVGLVGLGTVAQSYSKARVTGTSESVGGLVGATIGEGSRVDSCYAQGDVKGTSYVAGLVGQVSAGWVWRCYSTGKVTGNAAVGGLVGYQRVLAQVMGCLWDKDSSGQMTSAGGTGKTTAEMKVADTYGAMNWESSIWAFCDGINYPVFWWQIPLGDLKCPDGVDFLDFVLFAAHWRDRDCGEVNLNCDGADFDKSGSVEFRDLAIFAENWLAGIE